MHYIKRQHYKDFQSSNAIAEKHTVKVIICITPSPKHSFLHHTGCLSDYVN